MQSVVATRVVTGARILDETRLIHHVLASEIGQGQAGLDWRIQQGELHLRAFRGMGFGCGKQTRQWLGSRRNGAPGFRREQGFRGLVLSGDGSWRGATLTRVSRARNIDCQEVPGFSPEIWYLDPPVVHPLAGLYFERGAYRFSDGAVPVPEGPRGVATADGDRNRRGLGYP